MNRTLVVDPAPSGHRAFYLSLIAAALGPERMNLLVPEGHQHLSDCFQRRGLNLADFKSTHAKITEGPALVAHASAVASEQSCSRVFFAFLDSCIEPLLKYTEHFSCPVGGIWFHPYALDSCYRWLPPFDKRLRHRRTVHRALRHLPNNLVMDRLFFLDPLASYNLKKLNFSIPSTILPDPWEKIPELGCNEARGHFQLPQGRIVFLHIGSSEKRKGLSDALAAFQELSNDPSLNSRILLLRVGENNRLGDSDRSLLESLTTRGLVKTVDAFVPESEFIEYFAACDWVLLPYRNFRHSSGILSNAIAANKPVIAADYGMIAGVVRESNCGILFRHRSKADLVRAIQKATSNSPPIAAPNLRERLSPDYFISTLRNHLAD